MSPVRIIGNRVRIPDGPAAVTAEYSFNMSLIIWEDGRI